ncbi:histidine kinase [Streptomyces sp. ODS28]|uniref:sensor histidine kinase n=1 Tax=Streptomyces sp. ODS28 TaxID=3136688 RepID=UPI0031E5AA9D
MIDKSSADGARTAAGTGPAHLAGHPAEHRQVTGRTAAGGAPLWARRAWRWLRRPVVSDVLVTAVEVFLAVTSSVKNPMMGPFGTPWMNHVLAAVLALALLARRRWPGGVAVVAMGGHLLHSTLFSPLFAFYAVGAYRGPRNRLVTWGTAGLGLLAFAPWGYFTHLTLGVFFNWVMFGFAVQVLLPLVIGLYVGARRAVLAGLVERAERAEREQLLLAEAARVEERTRIAGEMHDVVSHQVSLMVVHANALEAIAHDPDTTKEAAATIRTAGRQALDELREMIGVLRSTPGEDKGEEADAPQTLRDRVAAMVDSSRAAGLHAELLVEGEPRALPDPAERAAHRVVQEGLTNVHKHAPGSDAQVRLDYGVGELRVTVANSRPGPKSAGEPLLPSGGHGLIGLGERVRLAGGTMTSGPRPDGGFEIAISLPAPQDPE